MKSLPLLLVVWLLLCLAVMQMLVWQLHLWQPTVRWFHSCGIAQLGETLEFVGAKKKAETVAVAHFSPSILVMLFVS